MFGERKPFMKQIISIILSLILVISIIPFSVFATNQENSITKEVFAEALDDKYDVNGNLKKDINYTWDYCVAENENSFESDIIPRWSPSNSETKVTHNTIIEDANSLIKRFDLTTYIPDEYIDLVKESSRFCDKGYTYDNDTTETEDDIVITKVAAIQGTKNYVLTFKYL